MWALFTLALFSIVTNIEQRLQLSPCLYIELVLLIAIISKVWIVYNDKKILKFSTHHSLVATPLTQFCSRSLGGGGGVPSSRLMGMHCWMGLYFHGRIDYNGVTVTFSLELLERDLTFSAFGIWGIRKFC